MQAETIRAAHLASIGELAAGVAHEINNPISGIINYAEILSDESETGSRQNDIAERIIKEGGRISNIVRSLLSFARDRGEEKRPVNVKEILTDTLALIESQLRVNGIKLTTEIPEELPDIIANPQQIQQVFLNILNNARYALNQKYSGKHDDKMINITVEESVTPDGRSLNISFYDQGTGISPDIIEKVMIPFFTTKPAGKGTGLGLSISHGIIADHGGKLTVDSIPGEMTRLVIAIPAKENHIGKHSYH